LRSSLSLELALQLILEMNKLFIARPTQSLLAPGSIFVDHNANKLTTQIHNLFGQGNAYWVGW
jgi:hypothetical protein